MSICICGDVSLFKKHDEHYKFSILYQEEKEFVWCHGHWEVPRNFEQKTCTRLQHETYLKEWEIGDI